MLVYTITRLRADRSWTAVAAALIAVLLIVSQVEACTTFCLRQGQQVLVGKNYDWNIGYGMLVVNKRNVAKTSALDPKRQPAKWTSKYGSLTFNQYGRDFPMGGMNEAGLVVELMWLDETRYPAQDARPAVGSLEWIQYQLDNFKSIQEVVQNGSKLRIASSVPIHFMACDGAGGCASLEFLDGQFVSHTGKAMPAQTLTNDTYEDSLTYLKKHRGFGGQSPIPTSIRSLDRFVRASAMVESFKPSDVKSAIVHAFEALTSVAQGDYTQWSIVYDVGNGRVHFRTQTHTSIKQVDFAALDFDCTMPVKVFDINQNVQGDVSDKFVNYTRETNRKLIEQSYKGTSFLAGATAAEIDEAARHPETSICQRT